MSFPSQARVGSTKESTETLRVVRYTIGSLDHRAVSKFYVCSVTGFSERQNSVAALIGLGEAAGLF